MRRLIYSQLPLPLGTLPRPTAPDTGRPRWRRTGHEDDADTRVGPVRGRGRARLWAKGPVKVNQAGALFARLLQVAGSPASRLVGSAPRFLILARFPCAKRCR